MLIGTFGMFVNNLPITNAALALKVFHSGPSGYGLLSSVVAVGSALGALVTATRRTPRLRSNITASYTVAALYLAAVAAPGLVGYAAVLAAIGAATMILVTTLNTTVQLAAEESVRGRVTGLYMLVFVGAGAVGGPLVGAVTDHIGPRSGLLLGGLLTGAVTTLVAVLLARATKVRVRLRRGTRLSQVVTIVPARTTVPPAPIE